MNVQYRDFIKDELGRRCARNSSYSLRSFARDLGLSPSTLSEVINRKCGISPKVAVKVAQKLNLTESEQVLFKSLVESETLKTEEVRKKANRNLRQIARKGTLSDDVMQIISGWYHFVILEMLALEDVQHEPEWFARRLGLELKTVEAALDRLIRVGMLKFEKKRYQDVDSFTTTQDNVPSHAIRTYHRQNLEQAAKALENQSVEERNFSSVVLAVESKAIPEIAERIKKFRRKLVSDFGKAQKADEVYTFSAQLFRSVEKKK